MAGLPVMSPAHGPASGLVADLVPSLEQLMIDGKTTQESISAAERSLKATGRLILGYWFDQAARLTLARTVHKLKGAGFRQFASEIGITGSRAFDLERLDGHRDEVFEQCEREAVDAKDYRWPSWQAVVAELLPSKVYLAPVGRTGTRRGAETKDTAQTAKAVTWLHGSDEWSTPRHVFDFFDRHFHFAVDTAASRGNAKCKVFWTKRDDGLRQTWPKGKAVWMNPPYSEASKWAKRASEASETGTIVVGLLANRSATKWYADYVVPFAAVIQLTGRIPFQNAEDKVIQGDAPFHSIIVIWPATAAKRIMKYCTIFPAALLRI